MATESPLLPFLIANEVEDNLIVDALGPRSDQRYPLRNVVADKNSQV